ncbi:hypothetical protein MHH56_18405 [Paenibacillus sp. FSL K6-3182]|uniref:hypothetical protein n=1 Tax=Paenibacillus sp. FSL K6-3182 TaxID=2921495 RepID=UPI0030D212B0
MVQNNFVVNLFVIGVLEGAIIKKKNWIVLSFICVLLGLSAWLTDILFEHMYKLWLLTFLINPLGFLFGLLGRSKWGMITNVLMTISVFIFMFIGYLIAALFGGQP